MVSVPPGSGEVACQERPGSIRQIVYGPPGAPFCLDEPEVPTANGPSSRLRCSRGSQLGNRSMSVQADHVAAASAWMTAATSSAYFMPAPLPEIVVATTILV